MSSRRKHKERMLAQQKLKQDIAWTRNEIKRLEHKLASLHPEQALVYSACEANLHEEKHRLAGMLKS